MWQGQVPNDPITCRHAGQSPSGVVSLYRKYLTAQEKAGDWIHDSHAATASGKFIGK